MEQIIPSIIDIRKIIESIKPEKYRYAFMYQFLVGASISEVCGKYAPKGKDVIRASIKVDDEDHSAAIFIIRNKKPKYRGKYRVCAIPLNSQYEPWTQQVVEWFESHRNEEPFNYCERAYGREVEKAFKGYFWLKAEYQRGPEVKISRRKKVFRSEDIRDSRKQNLTEFYLFNNVDLALFGAWNEPLLNVRMNVEIENILKTEIKIDDLSSLKERVKRYFGKLLRYFDELRDKIEPVTKQLRIGADLSRAIERAFNIIELVEHINIKGMWHFNAVFINESMRFIYEILSDCKDKTDFISKIASLSPLFEINTELLKKYVKNPDDKRSIRLIKDILIDNDIIHDSRITEIWFNIQELRTMVVHSIMKPRRYMELLIYFGQPQIMEPNYSSLWDNVLDRYIVSLKLFLQALNTLEIKLA